MLELDMPQNPAELKSFMRHALSDPGLIPGLLSLNQIIEGFEAGEGNKFVSSNTLTLPRAAATGGLTLGTTMADVPGATLSIKPKHSLAFYLAIATFDFSVSVAAAGGACIGQLVVDITASPEQAILGGSTTQRGTVSQAYVGTLSGGTTHTLKLQGAKNIAGVTATANNPHTTLTVVLFDINLW